MKDQTQASLDRTLKAVSGTAAVAGSNMVLVLLLLNSVSAEHFGVFAFAQVLVNFGFGLSNAVLGSPLTVALVRQEDQAAQEDILGGFLRANLILSVFGSCVVFAVLLALGQGPAIAALFALGASLLWVRWYGRTQSHATLESDRVVRSDLAYGAIVMIGAVGLYALSALTVASGALLLASAAVAGTLALGGSFTRQLLRGLRTGSLAKFGEGFRQHGRHALVGVTATETTTNSHAYIVTALFGPAAFAPIAAATLLFRPTALAAVTMTQLERPRLGRLLHTGQVSSVRRSLRQFGLLSAVTWVGNVLLVVVVTVYLLEYLVPESNDPRSITLAALFLAVTMAFFSARSPASALAQAAGKFQPLARAAIVSGFVTLPIVFVTALVAGPIWSLLGTVIGQCVAAILVIRLAREILPAKP